MQKVIVGLRKFICVCCTPCCGVHVWFFSFKREWLRRRAHGMPIRCWGDLCFLNSTLLLSFWINV